MVNLKQEDGGQLSEQIERLVAERLGQRLAFVCVVKADHGMGIFTNCETAEIAEMLLSGLQAVQAD